MITWSGIFATIIFTTGIHAKLPEVCKLENGDPGFCIPRKSCPKFEERENSKMPCISAKALICCPAMQRIVTPNNPQPPLGTTQRPALPTFPTALPPNAPTLMTLAPTPVPIIEVTNQPTPRQSSNVAAAKCEEYKHRVIKRSSVTTYVFGGIESMGKEFPHMAALGYTSGQKLEYLCGGSLISEQFVLTAAHCLSTPNLGELVRVRLGDINLQSPSDDAGAQDFGVTQKIVHPSYRPPLQYNDIGLVKLDHMAQFNEYIAPICLEVNRNLPNTNFIATGWGKTESEGSQSDTLMKVDLDYFANDVCNRNYASISPQYLPYGILDDTQICAGSYSEEKDTCQGDSGGPLQIRDDALYIVGITSFGKVCGEPNSPAVYTRVSYYVPWIEQVVWG